MAKSSFVDLKHWPTVVAVVLFFTLFLVVRETRSTQAMATVFAIRLPTGHVFLYEDPRQPRLRELRRQEHLDDIVRPYHTDIDKILALSQWASSLFKASTPYPSYPAWDALTTLRMIRNNETGGFCAQYAIIFAQACQSFGYSVQYVDLATENERNGHFLVSVYIKSAKAWVAFEPEKGIYYIDELGQPLSVEALHQYTVGLREGKVSEFPGNETLQKEELQIFYNFRIYLRNNFLTVPVFVSYRESASGTQMLFEPYRLRWFDSRGKYLPESNPSFSTGDYGDITFPLDLDVYSKARCQTEDELDRLLKQGADRTLYKIRMPKAALWSFVKNKLIKDPSYQPLQDGENSPVQEQ